jgi:hypothetical protein
LCSWSAGCDQGCAFIEAYLKRIARPVQAFCGIEMRQPVQLTFDRWSGFNVTFDLKLAAIP